MTMDNFSFEIKWFVGSLTTLPYDRRHTITYFTGHWMSLAISFFSSLFVWGTVFRVVIIHTNWQQIVYNHVHIRIGHWAYLVLSAFRNPVLSHNIRLRFKLYDSFLLLPVYKICWHDYRQHKCLIICLIYRRPSGNYIR